MKLVSKKIVVIHPKGAYSINLSFVKGIKTRELVKVLRRNNADNKK